MPFECQDGPATNIHQSSYGKYQIIVVYEHNYFGLDVFVNYLEWDIVRVLWIGFYKNDKNDDCLIHSLPKDIVKHIFTFLGVLKENVDNLQVDGKLFVSV